MNTKSPDTQVPDSIDSGMPDLSREEGIFQRTWEMELLISGAVVFALIQIPHYLDTWFQALGIHFQKDIFMILMVAYAYMLIITYTLIVSFVFHLTARALWIGLIGLFSVYRGGIKWENVNYGPFTKDIYKSRILPLPDYIRKTNKFCNLIFSFSFMVVLQFAYSTLLNVFFMSIAFFITRFILPGTDFVTIFIGMFAGLFLVLIIPTVIDKSFGEKIRNMRRFRFMNRFMEKSISGMTRVFFFPLYGAINLTFFSNIRKKFIYPIFTSVGIVLGIFAFVRILSPYDIISFNDYAYFPHDLGDKGVETRYYRNLRTGSMFKFRVPSIQGDVIEDPFVKLFIPFKVSTHTSLLEEICPDLDELQSGGFNWKNPDMTDSRREEALSCLAKLHQIYLNGTLKMDLDYLFYREPETGMSGIITYISVAELPSGKNKFRIIEAVPDKVPDSSAENPAEPDDPPKEFFIPFWVAG